MDIKPYMNHPPAYEVKGTWGLWLLLVDAYNVLRYGFPRFPMPGSEIDVQEAETLVAKMEAGWQNEARTRDREHHFSGAPKFTELPLNAKLWLYQEVERLKAAREPPAPSEQTNYEYDDMEIG